jgi:hypothetical protein
MATDLAGRVDRFRELPAAIINARLTRQLATTRPTLDETLRWAVQLNVTKVLLELFPEALILKGQPLAVLSVPNPPTRWMSDIDFLIEEKDLSQAIVKLKAVGFIQASDVKTWAYNQIMFTHPQWNTTVEVHWRLAMPMFPCPSYEQLRTRSIKIRIGDLEVPTLGLEDTVIHLGLHLLQHLGEPRIAIDLAGLLDRHDDELDFHQLNTIAAEYGLQRIVELAMTTANPDHPTTDVLARSIARSLWELWHEGLVHVPNKATDYPLQLATGLLLTRARGRAMAVGVISGLYRVGNNHGPTLARFLHLNVKGLTP